MKIFLINIKHILERSGNTIQTIRPHSGGGLAAEKFFFQFLSNGTQQEKVRTKTDFTIYANLRDDRSVFFLYFAVLPQGIVNILEILAEYFSGQVGEEGQNQYLSNNK